MPSKRIIAFAGAILLVMAIWGWKKRPLPPIAPGPTLHEAAAQSAPAAREIRRRLPADAPGKSPEGPAIHLRSGVLRPSASDEPLAHARPSARGYPWLVLFDAPLRPDWRARLESAGAGIRAYLPDNALLVEAPPDSLGAVRGLPHVAWSGEYRPRHKIQPLLAGLARQEPRLPVPVTVQTFSPDDVDGLLRHLAAAGASDVRGAPAKRWGLVRAVLPAREAAELSSLPEVQWIEYHEPPRVLNDFARAADRLNVDAARDALGLDGTGQIVAIADTGLDTGRLDTLHPDFAGRLIQVLDTGRTTNWSDTYYHGTHVAGSLLGTGAASGGQYRGAAPGARMVFQSIMTAYSTLNLPEDLNDFYRPAYDLGARIHSDSWGSAAFGEYTADSMTSDEFVWDHPDMLLVYAAGNDGADYDRDGVVDPLTLGSPASAKNVLSVGAGESGRPAGSGGLTDRTYGSAWPIDYRVPPISTDRISSSPDGAPPGMAAFSSRGPAADGRAKPDVVAPGTDVVSVRSRASTSDGWGVLGANTNYCFMGGTSMSTPLASGAATLLRQYCVDVLGLSDPSAALLKAALAGSARSLFPGQYGTGDYLEIPEAPRPNSVEGWGQIDVAGAVIPSNGIQAVFLDSAAALETGGSNVFSFSVFSNAPLNVVLAYSDYPSALSAAFHLVNDLDLLLIDPDGQVHHPNGLDGPDRLNNLEGIDLAAAATGRWTLAVSAANVPEGPQPYAIYLRGAVHLPIDIDHEPLVNTLVTNEPYVVVADVTSPAEFDPASVQLNWRAPDDGGGFSHKAMSTVDGVRFEASIPPRPVGTRIEYYLSAGPADLPTTHPAGAPTALHAFDVAPPVALAVSGSPSNVASADPAYGLHELPSNLAVQAKALWSAGGVDGWRTACVGWQGTGSVPPTGATDVCEFTIAADSDLVWQWQEQVALMHTSSPYGALGDVVWHPRDASVSSLVAPESHRFNNVPLTFAGWTLDGTRFPPDNAPSPRQMSGIPMPGPRLATATYLATALDADENGLPDWFERRYYGQLGQDRYADADDDGFEDEIEAADHTDPLDPASVPSPPVIQHVPLPSSSSVPAPWTVSATITDNYQVASATLHWRRNGGLLRSASMTNAGDGIYRASIPSPARDGDRIVYSLSAADPAGFVATSASWTVDVSYARMTWSPDSIDAAAPADTRTNRNLFVWNVGSQPLEITLSVAPLGFADDVESGTNGWTRPDGNVDWHVSAQESHSPAHAWYCGQEIPRVYRNSTHASLVTPSIQLAADSPRLDFMHWARFEPDHDFFPDGVHYWDSGVLEITDNDGLTWQSLVPEGGYPGLITSNMASPFAPDTPCFVDTDGWEPVGADLSAFAGRAVRIRFRFGADAYVVGEGWRLDDVVASPRTLYDGWLSLPPTNAVVPVGLGLIFPLGLDTAPIPPMEAGHLALLVHHNDPERPSPLVVPVALRNTTRRVRVATDGDGEADPGGETLVQENQPFAVELSAHGGSFLADVSTNSVPAPLPDVVSNLTLSWPSLAGNLDLHAVFAPTLEDGLVPPEWLAQYGLTSRNWMAESSLDPDRDGLLTWQEHHLGSSPIDPADAPLVVDIAPILPGETDGRLVWHAFTNRAASYDLLGTDHLPDGFASFTNLPAAPPVMTSPPLPADHRFFGILKK